VCVCVCVCGRGGVFTPEVIPIILDRPCITYLNICRWSGLVVTGFFTGKNMAKQLHELLLEGMVLT